MNIWKRATVDLPPTERSLDAKYVNQEVRIYNGKTIGPAPGFVTVGWAAQIDKYPMRQIVHPPLSGKYLKFGTFTSMTITRGVQPVQMEQVEWNHLMQMPNNPNIDYHESVNVSMAMRLNIAHVAGLLLDSSRSDFQLVREDPSRALEVAFTPTHPIAEHLRKLAKQRLREYYEEKLTHGDTAKH